MDLQIIYEDNKMFVCNKPTGVLAQSGKSFDVDMVSALMTYRKKKGEDTFVGVINRLDRQVSGLMLFAKTKEEAARLNRLMQQNSFNKHYYAVICGKPPEEKGAFVDYLLRDGRNNTSSVVSKGVKDAKRAELEYEVLKSMTEEGTGRILTLVKIHLITGRHHQIRVQFAYRGLGLLGDTKYCNMVNTGNTGNKGTKGTISNTGNISDSDSEGNTGNAYNAMNTGNAQYAESYSGKDGIALCAYSLEIGKQHFEIEPEDEIFVKFKNYNQ